MTKIIDKTILMQNYGEYGNDFLRDIINMFFEEHVKDIDGINQAIDSDNPSKLDFHAHKIKSSFRNFSNPCPPADIAYQLEIIGKSGTTQGAQPLFEQLKFLTQQFVKDLQEILSEIN